MQLTFSAASEHCLEHDRVTNLLGLRRDSFERLVVAVVPPRARDLRRDHDVLRRRLVSHAPNRRRRRADERNPVSGAALREARVLGEEAVARMNTPRTHRLGHLDDVVAPQVALRRRGRSNVNSLVRLRDMLRVRIRVAEDRDGLDPETLARRNHPARNLPAVCDQNLLQHPAYAPTPTHVSFPSRASRSVHSHSGIL